MPEPEPLSPTAIVPPFSAVKSKTSPALRLNWNWGGKELSLVASQPRWKYVDGILILWLKQAWRGGCV